MEIKTEKNGDCLEVISHKLFDGYTRHYKDGMLDFSHRHSYREYKGPIPKGMVIMHTCDNRRCINPDHLVLGTHQDNVKDRDIKNRTACAERNGRSKLNKDTVLIIFHDETTPKMHLAKRFGVDSRVIRDIKNRKTWKSVTENPAKPLT